MLHAHRCWQIISGESDEYRNTEQAGAAHEDLAMRSLTWQNLNETAAIAVVESGLQKAAFSGIESLKMMHAVVAMAAEINHAKNIASHRRPRLKQCIETDQCSLLELCHPLRILPLVGTRHASPREAQTATLGNRRSSAHLLPVRQWQ